MHDRAGSHMADACQSALAARQAQGEEATVPLATAVMTPGFDLPCKRVIHSVTPRIDNPHTGASRQAIQDCYQNCLENCIEGGFRTIAFPELWRLKQSSQGMSSSECADAVAVAVKNFLRHPIASKVDKIVLTARTKSMARFYNQALQKHFSQPADPVVAVAAPASAAHAAPEHQRLVSVHVPSTMILQDYAVFVTEAVLHARAPEQSDVVTKLRLRFSEFKTLRANLLKLCARDPSMALYIKGLPFPEKKMFGSKDAETVRARRGQLQAFVQTVASLTLADPCSKFKTVSLEPGSAAALCIREFLELPTQPLAAAPAPPAPKPSHKRRAAFGDDATNTTEHMEAAVEHLLSEKKRMGHAAVAGAAGAENQPSPTKKRRLAKQSAVVAAGSKGAFKQPRATLGVYVERKQGFTEGNRFITEQDL